MIEGSKENKSFSKFWVDSKTVFETQIVHEGPKRPNLPQNQFNSKGRIEGNIENDISTT